MLHWTRFRNYRTQSFKVIACQFSFVVYSKRLRMVIDAIGGALQPETTNGHVDIYGLRYNISLSENQCKTHHSPYLCLKLPHRTYYILTPLQAVVRYCNYSREQHTKIRTIDCGQWTMAESQKSAILSCHFCHKMPWHLHLHKLAMMLVKKSATAICHGHYLTTMTKEQSCANAYT